MAPNIVEDVLEGPDHENTETKPETEPNRKYVYAYRSILAIAYWHVAALYGLYLGFTSAKWETNLFGIFVYIVAAFGLIAGVHRLWSHKSYKATTPLQIILMLFHSIANQHTVAHWVRDHRMHHKYSDTDADPHNANRGFFYSHIGWLMVKKHPEVIRRGKMLDMSDIDGNPVLQFQKKYATPLLFTMSYILPTVIPVYFWNETISNSWHINMLRFVLNLNGTFLINSAAHMWGSKPYDKTIRPAQSISVIIGSFGEGFHNYHHAFPCDYRAAELGNDALNFSKYFIELCAKIGWAYDLKTVPEDVIRKRALRTGDGTNHWGL